MKKAVCILALCMIIPAQASATWVWDKMFCLSNHIDPYQSAEEFFEEFPQEITFYDESMIDIERYWKGYPYFTLFFENKDFDIIVLVDFDGSKLRPEKLLRGISYTFRSFKRRGYFAKIFELLEQKQRLGVAVRLFQEDGKRDVEVKIEEDYAELYTDFFNGIDESVEIFYAIKEIIN